MLNHLLLPGRGPVSSLNIDRVHKYPYHPSTRTSPGRNIEAGSERICKVINRSQDFFVVVIFRPIGVFGGIGDLNRSTLDDVGPVGAQDQQMRVLSETSDLGEQQKQIIREDFPKVTVY